jgi:F-type H+-transporting ATPase subunit epsilon
MADTLHLEVITPDRKLLEADVTSVQVPGLDGELGILPGHAFLVSQLRPAGLLSYVADGGTTSLAISDGFVEVTPESVKVLAEMAERPEDIDVNRAIAAKERAERELARASTDTSVDATLAATRLERAQIRLQIANRKS